MENDLSQLYEALHMWFYLWLTFRCIDIILFVSRRIAALIRSGASKE